MRLHTHFPASSAAGSSASATNSDQPIVLLGQSVTVRRLRTQIERIAPYLRTALLIGEAGSGKAQIARALHDAGSSPDGPFVPCSAVVFAQALFGERLGADATSVLDSVQGGTLFLCGVDDLAYPLQGSLLRFLTEREAMRMSSPSAVRAALPQRGTAADFRVIAGSRRDLRTLSSLGQFRSDLYAKLSALEVRVPALRDRAEDIEVIADALLERISSCAGTTRKVLGLAVSEALMAQAWRENLRDLERVLTDAAALAPGGVVEEAHLPGMVHSAATSPAGSATPGPAGDERLDTVVQRHVLRVLTRCRGNKLRAAEVLGISRSTLYRMLDSGTFAAQPQQRGE